MFYPRHTPSMIVNNIPQSTVGQMAAFQSGYRSVWVVICLSGHQASVGQVRKFGDEVALPESSPQPCSNNAKADRPGAVAEGRRGGSG